MASTRNTVYYLPTMLLLGFSPDDFEVQEQIVPNAPCYFLLLPLELRLQIYEQLYLRSGRLIAVSHSKRHVELVTDRRQRHGHTKLKAKDRFAVLLLRTCKQINSEATPILYSKNKFLIGRKGLPPSRTNWQPA